MYTDITKAFDSVSHKKLITILSSYGINSKLIAWFENIFANRSQVVKINNTLSPPLPITSGVLQGSVIGPLTFVIVFNDVMLKVQSRHNIKIALFADDAKFISNDVNALQACLETFSEIISEHQLQLAPHKSYALHIGKKNLQSIFSPTFAIDSKLLNNVSKINDLGIVVQDNLKWEQHINHITTQATLTSYQILKSFRSKNIWTLLLLYTTYIRPRLEYNTEVWSPYYKKDIVKVERVQRYYTKVICQRCNIPFLSYADRLYKLNLRSLEDRRKIFDLLLMYKIVNNLSYLKFNDYFDIESNPYTLRNNTLKIRTKTKLSSKAWN